MQWVGFVLVFFYLWLSKPDIFPDKTMDIEFLGPQIFSPYNIIIFLSGACFLAGTIFLALSIEWQLWEDLKKHPNVTTTGRTNMHKFVAGIILNGIGYTLLITSLIIPS
jgi:hypothetical protein